MVNYRIHTTPEGIVTKVEIEKKIKGKNAWVELKGLMFTIIGSNFSRAYLPNWRVPRFSPNSLKLNITIALPIHYHLRMSHYTVYS